MNRCLSPPCGRVPIHSASERKRPPERGPPGDFFCGSFFWSLKKMSHEGSTTPPPLLSADFWLDPKTGKKGQGLPKIG
jgi:hypothetical protein